MPYTRNPRIYYERTGSGEPLLMMTGWMLSSAVMESILPTYAEHFDCIAYDHRWAGRSQAPFRLTSIPELASDAVRLLDELDVDSAHVYGLSMGGIIALELALRFPERVRGLVLAGATAGGPRTAPPGPRRLTELGLALGQEALARRSWPPIAPVLFSDEFRRRHPDRVRELTKPFGRHWVKPWGAFAQTLATVYHDTVSRLPQVQAPTLLMQGEHDALSPLANSRLMAARIPDSEFVIVPGAGHAIALERPELSLELMVDWHRRHSPIHPGHPRTGLTARIEPLTRAFALHTGALRTSASLLGLGKDIVTGRRHRELALPGRAEWRAVESTSGDGAEPSSGRSQRASAGAGPSATRRTGSSR